MWKTRKTSLKNTPANSRKAKADVSGMRPQNRLECQNIITIFFLLCRKSLKCCEGMGLFSLDKAAVWASVWLQLVPRGRVRARVPPPSYKLQNRKEFLRNQASRRRGQPPNVSELTGSGGFETVRRVRNAQFCINI